MGEAITTLEGCTRLFSKRGTGGGMQAADTNALSGETPTGIGGLQAEDGIRDSVASRGLGDVYKRQMLWGR